MDYSLYYTCLVFVLTATGFITGVLGLFTIFGFKYVAGMLGLSNDFGYLLLDKITLLGFVLFYLVYQYAGIRIIYKEGIKEIIKEKRY